MGELICWFYHEIDAETNLCAAGVYHAKRTKNDVKHVSNLTKKWIDMAKVINDDVLLRKPSDGDVAANTIISPRSKHAYKLSKGNAIRLCENLNGQHMTVTMMRIGSR